MIHAKIMLEPEELRQEFGELLEQIEKKYRG